MWKIYEVFLLFYRNWENWEEYTLLFIYSRERVCGGLPLNAYIGKTLNVLMTDFLFLLSKEEQVEGL